MQLCVCLAILAIQMKEWKDVLSTVVQTLGNDVESHAAILDFLRVLPEEVTEGRKITLSVRGSQTDEYALVLHRPTGSYSGWIQSVERNLMRTLTGRRACPEDDRAPDGQRGTSCPTPHKLCTFIS